MKERARRWRSDRPIDLHVQLGPLRRGSGDPTWGEDAGGGIWRTSLTPHGPGVERLSVDSVTREVVQSSYGPGADWLSDRLPRLLGADDDPTGFRPPDPLRMTAKRYANWRAGRTDLVLEALIPAVLEQKVTGKEAWLGWRTLVRTFGTPAPTPAGGPSGLRVFPAAAVWLAIPSWEWHRAAVDNQRSTTVLEVARQAESLERVVDLPRGRANERLRHVPGVGIWTTAEVAQRALGDADAVSYRDYHLSKHIVFTLTGETDGTDERLAELLLPYGGHRYRIQRLVELGGHGQPRRGPRMTVHDMRTM
jgi:3-methyladenine DNA glycosylase/8-oxoguanine DNA glycosylase